MCFLFNTADRLGEQTGGGLVAAQEHQALTDLAQHLMVQRRDPTLGAVTTFSRTNLASNGEEPWKWDQKALELYRGLPHRIKLTHIYSGTWPTLVPTLKANGTKVCITIAAHDRVVSRQEHEKLGWPFPYPHLIEESAWQRYIEGYRQADVIICPSTVAAHTVRNYGPEFAQKDIRVIPHGCELPGLVKPLLHSFVVGYCGSYGADKGVRYLLEAWKHLNYQDGSILILAGRDSTTVGKMLVEKYGGGNVYLAGWQKDMSDFYNRLALYIQPSATEGFGLEVLEAMAHGRPVICSRGAGAVDLVDGLQVDPGNVDQLVEKIETIRANSEWCQLSAQNNRERAALYTWDLIRAQYQAVWKEMLGWN